VFAYSFHLTGARDEAERLSVAAFMDAHDMVAAGGSIRAVRVWLLMRVHGRAPILPRDRRGGAARHLALADGRGIASTPAGLDPLGEDALVLTQWCGLRPAEVAIVLGMTAAAERRAGVPKALAATVPGFGAGSAGTAAGIGAIPLAAGVAKATLVAAAAAAAVGAVHTVAPGVSIPWPGGAGGHSSSSGTGSPSGSHGRTHAGGKHGGAGSHPAKSGNPSKRSHPSKPAHPVHPSHPDRPGHPAHPAKPTHPSRPSHPTHPSKPAKPSHPSQPSKRAQPSKP
jgi:hypothetical protein